LLQELVELASPFGQIVQSKLNVGPNRNQAFIEFSDVSLAVQMVNFFASSSEPAKVRAHDRRQHDCCIVQLVAVSTLT
jgi:RNA recognition motif. (a.k.a. RRM, RBD, or RNP domain)